MACARFVNLYAVRGGIRLENKKGSRGCLFCFQAEVERLFLFDLGFTAQFLHQTSDLVLLRLLAEFVFHFIK